MSATALTVIPEIQLPADPAEIFAKVVAERPDWEMLAMEIEGLDGAELLDMGKAGQEMLERIQMHDRMIRDFQKRFHAAWLASPFGQIVTSAQFLNQHRLEEEQRCATLREQYRDIQAQAKQEEQRRIDAEKARLEREEREAAEQRKQKELERLKAANTPEAQVEARQVQQTPVVTTVVSEKQAKAGFQASGKATTPRSISSTEIRVRTITDLKQFLTWLVGPGASYASQLVSITHDRNGRKSDELVIGLTPLKGDLELQVPGTAMAVRYETSNRGK